MKPTTIRVKLDNWQVRPQSRSLEDPDPPDVLKLDCLVPRDVDLGFLDSDPNWVKITFLRRHQSQRTRNTQSHESKEHWSNDITVISYHPDGKKFGLYGPDEIDLLQKLLEDAQKRKALSMSQNAQDKNRCKIVYIEEGERIDHGYAPEVLPPLTNVPKDVTVCKIWWSDVRRAIGFLIAHDSFDPIGPGELYPILEPEFPATENIDAVPSLSREHTEKRKTMNRTTLIDRMIVGELYIFFERKLGALSQKIEIEIRNKRNYRHLKISCESPHWEGEFILKKSLPRARLIGKVLEIAENAAKHISPKSKIDNHKS